MKKNLLGSFAAAANDIPSHNHIASHLYSSVGNPQRLRDESYDAIDCGKWIAGLPGEYVDFVWGWVKKWVEGHQDVVYAKVSTARTVEAQRLPCYYIEVYTWDAADEAQIERVRCELRKVIKGGCAYQKEEAALIGLPEYVVEEPGFIRPQGGPVASQSA